MAISSFDPRDGYAADYVQDPGNIREEIDSIIDGETPEAALDRVRTQARIEAFDVLIDSMLPGRVGNDLQRFLEQGWRQFVVMVRIARPEVFADASLRTLSEALGVSHGTLAKRQVELADALGVHFRSQKRESTRATYSQVQTDNHWRRRPEHAEQANNGCQRDEK